MISAICLVDSGRTIDVAMMRFVMRYYATNDLSEPSGDPGNAEAARKQQLDWLSVTNAKIIGHRQTWAWSLCREAPRRRCGTSLGRHISYFLLRKCPHRAREYARRVDDRRAPPQGRRRP